MLKEYTEETVRELFLAQTIDHKMSILHDDGMYRHVRFSREDSSSHAFEFVTYPNFLVVTGDMGSFVFRRYGSEDMFYFFTGPVSLSYWGEKLQAHSGDDYKVFSPSNLRATLKEDFEDRKDEYSEEAQAAIWDSIEILILREENARDAYYALEAFDKNDELGYKFRDAWEYDFREYSVRFMWICHAIQFGIAQYFEAKTPDLTI